MYADYCIVDDETTAGMAAAVRQRLDEGWVMYGPPLSHQGRLVQAMVRLTPAAAAFSDQLRRGGVAPAQGRNG